MSHPETKSVPIPFVKKSQPDLPKIKLTYFTPQPQKMKILLYMIFMDILKSLDLNGTKLI